MTEQTNDPRIVDRTERNAATSFRDHASGPPVEQPAVTGRPNDLSGKVGNTTMAERAKGASGISTGSDSRNSTLAERAKGGKKVAAKAVREAEDKSVKASSVKRKGG